MFDIEARGPVHVLRLNHGKVNALDVELLDALADYFTDGRAEDAGALVITGNGRLFSAGVDLARVVDGGAPYVARLVPALSRTYRALLALPRPVVAAVDGAAVAGGCVLACACHYRVMASGGGRIGVTELAVGVPFPVAAFEVMRHACGPAAEGLVMSARLLGPEEALAAGMIHSVVSPDELLDRATAMAEQLAAVPRDTFRLTHQRLRDAVLARIDHDTPLVDGDVERAWASPESAERIKAQLDRLRSR